MLLTNGRFRSAMGIVNQRDVCPSPLGKSCLEDSRLFATGALNVEVAIRPNLQGKNSAVCSTNREQTVRLVFRDLLHPKPSL